jgi:hypothetical protein
MGEDYNAGGSDTDMGGGGMGDESGEE